MEPKHKAFPVGYRFRPTDCEISKYFLTPKALGQPIRTLAVPEECHDIFARHPRDLPGYSRETHWYFYCRKPEGQVPNPHNIWKQIGEETGVFDRNNNDTLVGIKRTFTLVNHEEEPDDILLSDEDEPTQHNWLMDEFILPLTVSDTDWVFCHVFPKENEAAEES